MVINENYFADPTSSTGAEPSDKKGSPNIIIEAESSAESSRKLDQSISPFFQQRRDKDAVILQHCEDDPTDVLGQR